MSERKQWAKERQYQKHEKCKWEQSREQMWGRKQSGGLRERKRRQKTVQTVQTETQYTRNSSEGSVETNSLTDLRRITLVTPSLTACLCIWWWWLPQTAGSALSVCVHVSYYIMQVMVWHTQQQEQKLTTSVLCDDAYFVETSLTFAVAPKNLLLSHFL